VLNFTTFYKSLDCQNQVNKQGADLLGIK